jgi:hypothetical protein
MWLWMQLVRWDRLPNDQGWRFTAQVIDQRSPFHGTEVPLDIYFQNFERFERLVQAIGEVSLRRARKDPRLLLYHRFAGRLAAYVADWTAG